MITRDSSTAQQFMSLENGDEVTGSSSEFTNENITRTNSNHNIQSKESDIEKKQKGKKIPNLFRSRSKRYDKNKKDQNLVREEGKDRCESPSLDESDHEVFFKESKFGGNDDLGSIFKQENANSLSPPSSSVIPVLRDVLSNNVAALKYKQTPLLRNINLSTVPLMTILFENMGWFLSYLDNLSNHMKKALLKTYSQKITNWALQPWSESKDRALATACANMRRGLQVVNGEKSATTKEGEEMKNCWPVLNPVNTSELLLSIDYEHSFILPSAHFPILLSFHSAPKAEIISISTQQSSVKEEMQQRNKSEDKKKTILEGNQFIYRTKIEFLTVYGDFNTSEDKNITYNCRASTGGSMQETNQSTYEVKNKSHSWHDGNVLDFDTRSSWGYPGTLNVRLLSMSLDSNSKHRVASNEERGKLADYTEVGWACLDLSRLWKKSRNVGKKCTENLRCDILSLHNQEEFDHQGELSNDLNVVEKNLEVEVRVTVEITPINVVTGIHRQSMLLYKHDDDMRQEMLAIQFIDVCDNLLKASGLDLKILKYRCVPVGDKRGFIEWVPGTMSLSEICKPVCNIGSDLLKGNMGLKPNDVVSNESPVKSRSYENNNSTSSAFLRTGGWYKFESLRTSRVNSKSSGTHGIGLSGNNPVQEFFRSNAYDPDSPYFIRKEVLDNYVKSCAGYCIITYLLGVGDRHTDNLLLHQNGHFLHCDYAFILGQDPKMYLPMRITDFMVKGMGGHESDNFALFLSFAGAAFVTLRQHANARILLSLIRNTTNADIPDISLKQSPEDAIMSMHERFRFDLDDNDAISFIEDTIENSLVSKMWI
eukprot:CAMPEP_0184872546 /NCGR_PEP_ID=MMETSP0580-20130426/41351_1 /TAXON_ID=1118495 /ORGANISM="Dactyliosolen fragilissimus" /LENGTH=822 /DNA_ID=CAMNT_0027375363 /DNA_START=1786 /DNA_END=4251 /DNA_ORIENTATION=-